VLDGVRIPQSEVLGAFQNALRTREARVQMMHEQISKLNYRLRQKQTTARKDSIKVANLKYMGIHREGDREFGVCSPEKKQLKAEFDRQMEQMENEHHSRCEHEINLTK
jgi:hypothetical protein